AGSRGRMQGPKAGTRTLARARGAARCASGRQPPRDPGPSARIATRNITTKAAPRGGYAADLRSRAAGLTPAAQTSPGAPIPDPRPQHRVLPPPQTRSYKFRKIPAVTPQM